MTILFVLAMSLLGGCIGGIAMVLIDRRRSSKSVTKILRKLEDRRVK
jgi:hypothetical protein